jgi:RND superfamily putative drug exporter
LSVREGGPAGEPEDGAARAVGLAGGPSRFARWYAWTVVRLRYPIVLAWIVGAVAAVVFLPGLENQKSAPATGLVASNSQAIATQKRSFERFGTTPLAETAVVQRCPNGLSQEAQRRAIDRAAFVAEGRDPVLKDMKAALPVINAQGAPAFSRENSTTAVTFLFFDPKLFIGQQVFLAHELEKRDINRPDDCLVGITGVIPARVEQEAAISDNLGIVTIATILLIATVLAVTLKSVLAPLVTLLAAGIAYALAGRAIVALGTVTDVSIPREVEPLVVVLLLGIVTDYCIFFLSDMRTRILDGARPLNAAEAATARVAPIVITAGLIVAAGTATLLVGTMEFFRALGPGMAVTALVGLVVAVTLVPALMAILGRALFWPGAGYAARERRARRRDQGERYHGFLRHGIARLTAYRPAAALISILAIGGLAYGTYQLRHTELGLNLIQGLPDDSEARFTAEAAAKGFARGIVAPTEILVEEDGITERVPQLILLQEQLERQPHVAGVVGPREATQAGETGEQTNREQLVQPVVDATLSRDRGAARFLVVLDQDPLEAPAIETVETLQERMPGMLDRAGLGGARASFGGQSALSAETVAEAKDNLVRLSLAALLVNLVFLMVFLRAVIAPLYLLAASVLALGASLGLTTWLFQDFLGYGQIAYYIPFAAAVLLLSLGSDYNIFVVGRIWDEARKRPVDEAVKKASPEASGPITVAGIVLAGSFALLALIPLVPFREFAFVMAAGILIDAFIVRSLLAPSLITAFGRFSAPEPALPGRRTMGARGD